MFNQDHLPNPYFPNSLDLELGMARIQCLQKIEFTEIDRETNSFVRGKIKFQVHEQPLILTLFFENQSLERIHIDLKISEGFWEDTNYERANYVEAEFLQLFKDLKRHYTKVLGQPNYSGHQYEPDFPESENAWRLSYWRLGSVLFQVELDHSDKELPFFLGISWYEEPTPK